MVTTIITNRYGGYGELDWSFSNTDTVAYNRHIIITSARNQGKTGLYKYIYNSPVTQGLAPRPKTLQDFM
jgi:hypothetical protein